MRNFVLFLSFVVIFNISGQKNISNLPDYILLGADYASNTNTFGVSLNDVKQPNYLFTAGYFSKYNFDISYTAILTDNTDSTFTQAAYEHNLAAGYTLELSKKLYIYSGYTHMFHSPNSYALKSIFSDIFQLDALYYAKYYNGSLSLNHIWGKKNMFYVSLQNFAEFTIENFIHKNGTLNIQLGFSINISDNNYYNQLILDNYTLEEIKNEIFYTYPRRGINIINALDQNEEKLKDFYFRQNPELFEPDYKITTLDIMLPVYYSLNNLMISLSGFLSVPTATNELYEQYSSFQFSVGASYFFDL